MILKRDWLRRRTRASLPITFLYLPTSYIPKRNATVFCALLHVKYILLNLMFGIRITIRPSNACDENNVTFFMAFSVINKSIKQMGPL